MPEVVAAKPVAEWHRPTAVIHRHQSMVWRACASARDATAIVNVASLTLRDVRRDAQNMGAEFSVGVATLAIR